MRRGRPPYAELLTPREQEVLSLLQDGLTNEQIAERLGISESGARYHVSEILSKLGVESRQEAAQWQPERHRTQWSWLPLLPGWKADVTRRIVQGIAAVLVAGAVLAVTVLAATVLVEGERNGSNVVQHGPTATEESVTRVEDFRRLAAEALHLAQTEEPDEIVTEPDHGEAPVDSLMLFQIAWTPSTGVFTFRFTETLPHHWFIVQGPQSSGSKWHLIRQDIPNADQSRPTYTELDLSGVRHTPMEVLEVLEARTGLRFREVFLAAPGHWAGFAGASGGIVRCDLRDTGDASDPFDLVCSQPSQPPPTASP